MAKVMCEYDTVTKELKASKDGEELGNVKEASFYWMGNGKDGKPMHDMRIGMRETDKDHDMTSSHYLTAKNQVVEYLAKMNSSNQVKEVKKKQ